MRYIGKNGQDQFELSIGQQSSLLLRFIVWPFSWLVELVLNHVSELPEYLVLPLHPLLLAEHGKRPLLVRRINLVFFPQPEQKVSQLKHGPDASGLFPALLNKRPTIAMEI